jgi:hypothetical protein
MKNIAIVLSLFLSTNVFAGPEHDMPPVKVTPEFENLKGLVGTWEGTTKKGGQDQSVKVTYELTSGGTAILEKLMPGTPHEMVTVYANKGKEVGLTHFCMLGNQPEMKLKSAKEGTFNFEMVGNKGLSNKDEMHMHAVKLTLNGNKLTQEWTNYKGNKKGDVAVFDFTKKN